MSQSDAWANRFVAVTTSDSADLEPYRTGRRLTTGLYVGGAGNVAAVAEDGTVTVFTAPPVGSILPIAVRRINATNTTATVLVALYRT